MTIKKIKDSFQSFHGIFCVVFEIFAEIIEYTVIRFLSRPQDYLNPPIETVCILKTDNRKSVGREKSKGGLPSLRWGEKIERGLQVGRGSLEYLVDHAYSYVRTRAGNSVIRWLHDGRALLRANLRTN